MKRGWLIALIVVGVLIVTIAGTVVFAVVHTVDEVKHVFTSVSENLPFSNVHTTYGSATTFDPSAPFEPPFAFGPSTSLGQPASLGTDQFMRLGSASSSSASSSSATGDVDCSVSYSMTTPCEGDCWAAYEYYSGTVMVPPAGNGAPCPPLYISVSCANQMPCTCRGADLPLTPQNSVTVCGDCDYVQPGESCFVACAAPDMTMMGTPELMCVNGTWAFAGLMPTCNPTVAQCPPIMNVSTGSCTSNGIIVQPGSTCIGATNGDACTVSCMAGYAVPNGSTAVATCTNGTWTDSSGNPATIACQLQANCVAMSPHSSGGTGDTCAMGSCTTVSSTKFGRPAPGALLPKT